MGCLHLAPRPWRGRRSGPGNGAIAPIHTEGIVPEQHSRKERMDIKIAQQVNHIQSAFAAPEGGGILIRTQPADGGVGFMYAEGQLLVRYEYLGPVRAILEREFELGETELVITGVALINITARRAGRRAVRRPARATAKPPAEEPKRPPAGKGGAGK